MIVSLVPRTDFAPVPRVEIRMEESLDFDGGDAEDTGAGELDGGGAGGAGSLVDGGAAATTIVDVPAGTDRVTLWRRSENRSMKGRGGVERAFTGTLGLLDVEAGAEVTSTYELECWDGDVSLGRVPLGSVLLPWAGDPNGVVIQQPLDPKLHVVATNLAGSWPSLTRDAAGETVLPEGESYPTVVGFGPRQGAKEVAIDFGVATRADAQRLLATLGTEENPQLPVWLIRSHQGILPRVFFCHVRSLVEMGVKQRTGGEWTRFQAVVEECKPPAPALVMPTLTYSDLKTVFPTYSEMQAALPSYSAMATAWEYAGAAG